VKYTLRPAVCEDLETVLSWVCTAEQLKLWGGPSLLFPAEAASIWATIGASHENSFSLLNPFGQVVGFAQALPRDTGIHLARIIVSPALRGQGVGRNLCQQLIHSTIAKHRPNQITLKVYRNNTPALSLYQSLGFVAMTDEPNSESIQMCSRPNPSLKSDPTCTA